MMVSNSTKARVEGDSPGLWLRSSVGWSGARGWVSRHPTRSFMQYNLHLSRMFELRRTRALGPRLLPCAAFFSPVR